MKKKLIVIAGPTCVGKTELSIKLAEKFESEIISADARQFYKELHIGVAKPSINQLKKITHHFIGNLSIAQDYSVGEYEKDSLELLGKLFQKHDILFLCGGSGLYIDALCEGLNKFPKVDNRVKSEIKKDFIEKGIEYLNEELKHVDLETYNTIDKKNPRRVMRALEVYRTSKTPYSIYKKKKKKNRNFNTIFISIQKSRKELYQDINNRVDKMITDGLVNEVEKLYKYRNNQALQTIGYKEIFHYIEKKYSLEKSIIEIKKNSRRYAKRQINWFNKSKYLKYSENQENQIIQFIKNQL